MEAHPRNEQFFCGRMSDPIRPIRPRTDWEFRHALRHPLLQLRRRRRLLDQGGGRRRHGPARRGPGAARQGRPARARGPAAADHRRDHAAQDPRRAAGDRRALRRDQGAAARLLRRRLRRRWRRRSRSRASSPRANPGGAYEIRPLLAVPAGERCRHDRHRLDRRGADLGAAPGGRRAAALFPRPRHGRGGIPGRLPAAL